MFKLCTTVALLGCIFLSEWPTPSQAGETLVISTIEHKVKQFVTSFQPVADRLKSQLAAYGVTDVKVSLSSSQEGIVDGIRRKEIDVFIESPLIFAVVARKAGLKPALRRWKKGVAEYHTVLFTKADSAISSLSDLEGHTIAFESSFSSSGYLLPRAVLTQGGLKLAQLSDPSATPAPETVGYTFSMDEDNTALWVLKGKVAAGALDSATYDAIARKRPGDLKVIARTESIPRHIIGYRAGLDPAIAQALTRALLDMSSDEAGRAALEQFEGSRFDEFPDGLEAAYARITRLVSALNQPPTD